MKILTTGLNGLIGSRIAELLKDQYSFENVSRTTGVDITNLDQVQKAVSQSDAEIVLHLAAYTNVKEAETQKDLGEEGEAWRINVIGTHNVAKAAEAAQKKIIYFSSDMVFDGEHMPEGGYKETDTPNPLSWYAVTKFEGEKIIQSLQTPWVIFRPAYPYRASFEKPDFVRFFIDKLKEKASLNVLTDRIITPTFIDNLAPSLDTVIKKRLTGIYHTTGSESVSIYDAIQKIGTVFNLGTSTIGKTTRAEFLVGRPPEPENSSLNNTKISNEGIHFSTFEEGLQEIKKQNPSL